MDRTRHMPNSTEHESSSDDLIAELARLMAEEAQGERKASAAQTEAAAPAPSASQPKHDPVATREVPPPRLSGTSESVSRFGTSGNAVRVPGDMSSGSAESAFSQRSASLSDTTPTSVSAWGRVEVEDDDEPAQAEVVPDFLSTRASNGSADELDFSRHEQEYESDPDTVPAAEPVLSATPAPADDSFGVGFDGFSSRERSHPQDVAPAAPVNRAYDNSDLEFDDPIAELIAAQAKETETPELRFAPPEPAQSVVRAERDLSVPANPERRATPSESAFPGRRNVQSSVAQPRDIVEPTTDSGGDIDENVLNLLRAMELGRAEAAPAQTKTAEAREDQFSASPIFGLGSAEPVAAAKADPLDEIESLIGDAVSVSGNRASMQREPSLAPNADVDLDDAAFAAEAAIAAAAAETGRMERTRHAPEIDPVSEPRIGEKKNSTRKATSAIPELKPANTRVIVAAAAAATILVAVALGLFWMFGLQSAPDGDVPVLTSNTTDAKETISPNTETAVSTQPAIFDQPTASDADLASSEQIVSRDQSAEMAEDVRQVATAETADAGLANRKVRTVTVRPDGTIVSNDDTLAANEVLPVARPDVPTLANGANSTTDFQVATAPVVTEAATDAATSAVADPLADLVAGANAEAQGELVANAPYPAPVTANPAFGAPSAPVAVVTTAPVVTNTNNAASASNSNADTIDLIAGVANQVASQLPSATTTQTQTQSPQVSTPVASADTQSAAAYVQLSSQRSEEAARSTLATVSQRFGSLFNGTDAIVRRVDLGDRGIYYRVLVPANSVADANGVCASVKAAGGDCFVFGN